MCCYQLSLVSDSGRWLPCCSPSLVFLLLSVLQVPSSAASFLSTQSAAADDDDVFTFTEPGRSYVQYLQPPPPTLGSRPESEVGHVVGVELEFRTLVGSAPLLHRDPRRRPDVDPLSPETAERHVTGCTSEAEIRVQLKIGMLHVSATYDGEHVACVTVGQGKLLFHTRIILDMRLGGCRKWTWAGLVHRVGSDVCLKN